MNHLLPVRPYLWMKQPGLQTEEPYSWTKSHLLQIQRPYINLPHSLVQGFDRVS